MTRDSQLRIHPVVRDICRSDLKPDIARCGAFLDRLWDWHCQNPYHARKYTQIAHCLSASRLLPGLCDPYRASHVGMLYQSLGLYAKAREYAALALELAREMLPDGSPALARFYGNLAAVCGALRDFDRQLEYCRMELSLLLGAATLDRLELADCYSSLGSCHGSRGQYTLELEYQRNALDIRRELLPPNHPDLADSYSRVGSALCHTQSIAEGLEHQEKALRIRELSLPPDHLDLASSHINLASACYLLHRDQDALDHLWKALRIRQAKLPKNHPDLAQSHFNLGIIYHSLGNLRSSLEHYLRCLQIRREILPGSDPLLIRTCAKVAETYGLLGKHEAELEYFLQLLELQQDVIPDDHPSLVQPYRSVARAYADLGQPQQQLVYLRKAAHTGDADSIRQLATVLLMEQQHQEGLYWLEQAVQRKDVHSAYLLGSLYLGTPTLPRDLRCAIRMLEWAARNDHAKANRVLGQIFLARHPKALDYTPIDPRRALKHLLLARELGSTGDEDLIREAEALLRL